ncbi:glycosyltransferase family 2 protein [Variovorax sp. J22R24]|uniref:glycosyltransferase family 2 protein n=1 Tax=Variovorax gracilis TaxID=3053502 RepID=UPI00257714DC|nr:glycosyltransferase family 2 protein [Variovorax sp. J22R24]MDM0103694.1 glycosyltransferase family 2 protein [Variovorax sp. J22R24]
MIDVVVVNWNAGGQLLQCVESIREFGEKTVSSVTVVDNDSTDGSEECIERIQDVVLVRSGENSGFGRACNLGASRGEAEFLLFLNPDAALHAGTLREVMAFMRDPSNTQIGICGVQLIDGDGEVTRSCARFPSVRGFCSHAIGLDRWFPAVGNIMSEWDHANTREVNHVIGAFFLVRRKLFEALSGFDEQYFVYLEDVDFSRRSYRLGWRSVYLASANAFHAGGGTSRQIKALRLFYSLRSRLLYSFKHFSWLGAAFVLLVTLLFEPLSRSALAMTRRSLSSLIETWAAYVLLWRWLPQWAFRGVTR